MALLKCPDCGKMVSERAKQCPECGCPSEFFEEEVEAVEQNEKVEDNDTDEEFYFCEFRVKLPQEIKGITSKLGYFLEKADQASEDIEQRYIQAGSIDKFLENFVEVADDYIFSAVDDAVKILYQNQILISDSDFVGKYQDKYELDIAQATKSVYENYANILDAKEELEAYRNIQKSSRMRWQGGGFGLKGAIKGAVQATALNMASDVLHSFGDISRVNKDNELIQSKLKEMYANDKIKKFMINSVYNAIKNTYLAMFQEARESGKFREFYPLNIKKGRDVYESAKKYETDVNEYNLSLIASMCYDPTNIDYYVETYDLMLNGNNNFDKWIEYWGLESYFKNFNQTKMESDNFSKFIEDNGGDSFNFKDYSVSNIVKLRKIIYQYYLETGEQIPIEGAIADFVCSYFKDAVASSGLDDEKLIEWIPKEFTLEQFMEIIKQDKRYYEICVLSSIIDYKGEDKDLKVRKKLLEDGADIILYNNTSFVGIGAKGYAMTTKYIWDLKKEVKIPLDSVKTIDVRVSGGEYYMLISDGEKEIKWSDNSLHAFEGKKEYYAYVSNLIKIICERYGNNKNMISIENNTNTIVLGAGAYTRNKNVIFEENVTLDGKDMLLQLTDEELVFTSKKNRIITPISHVKKIGILNMQVLGIPVRGFTMKIKGNIKEHQVCSQKGEEWINYINSIKNGEFVTDNMNNSEGQTRRVYIHEKLKNDSKPGELILTDGLLLFEGQDKKNNIVIDVNKIKEVDYHKVQNTFVVWVKGKFFGIQFQSMHSKEWKETLENASKGIYNEVELADIEIDEYEIQKYILMNYDKSSVGSAINYYREKTGAELSEAREKVEDMMGLY